MGYSLICDFYVNKKFKLSMCFDELKNINQRRYAADLIAEPIISDTKIVSTETEGSFFNIDSFSKLSSKLTEKYRNAIAERERIKSERRSVPFCYQLEDYKEDVSYKLEGLDEMIEDYEYQISTCEKMIGFFTLFQNGYSTKCSEERDYENNDVEVYIYAE